MLRKLCFGFPIPIISPHTTRWRPIGEVLQQSRFSHLTELVFQIRMSASGLPLRPIVEEGIRDDLRELHDRGILSFQYNT